MPDRPRALVVGAGISGIACAAALAARGFVVEVRERGRAVGGRMASRRMLDSGTDFDGRHVDIGASYFTASDPDFVEVVRTLQRAGIVEEWTDGFHVAGPDGLAGIRVGPMRYRAPGGLRSVVDHLSRGLSVRLATPVLEVVDEGTHVVADGEEFDVAAICAPGPQAQRILRPACVPRELTDLAWEPVICVTLAFDERTWRDLDGVFVNDDPVITWIADDGRRRGDGAPVLTAHVHPVLAARHLQDPESVLPPVIGAVRRVLEMSDLPVWTDVHRWTFAKPMTAHERPYWSKGRLGAAGDAFAGGPRVESAWMSGNSLGQALVG